MKAIESLVFANRPSTDLISTYLLRDFQPAPVNFHIVERVAKVVDSSDGTLYCIYLVSFNANLSAPFAIYKTTDCELNPEDEIDKSTTEEHLKFSLPPSVDGLDSYVESDLHDNGASGTADDVEILNGTGSATVEGGIAQKHCPETGESRQVKHFKIQPEASANAGKDFFIGIDIGPGSNANQTPTDGYSQAYARDGSFSTPWKFTATVYEQD